MIQLWEIHGRPLETADGVFVPYTCPCAEHYSCFVLAGAEYDPTTDAFDRGVYDHVSPCRLLHNVEDGTWPLLEPGSVAPDRLHSEGGCYETPAEATDEPEEVHYVNS